jgi:DNA-binding MarR family transcriptional regulator
MTATGVAEDVREWRDLLARHHRVTCALERELQAGHNLGMSEYEVLERLTEERNISCRVQNLGREVHLSQSALSRVIGRLEQAGLVERKICAEDRRGVYVQLTVRGAQLQAEAQPTQRRVLRELLTP